MGSNHMHDMFRNSNKANHKIPRHDPQTGEVNPYYEELTGKALPKDKVVITPETDLDKFNRHLINTANADVDIRHKILMVNKFIETLGEKED